VSKRILFVIDGLAGGGAEKTLLRLARHMTALGHAAEIATLRDERALPVPDGVGLIPAFDTRSRRVRKLGEVGRRTVAKVRARHHDSSAIAIFGLTRGRDMEDHEEGVWACRKGHCFFSGRRLDGRGGVFVRLRGEAPSCPLPALVHIQW